MCNQEFRTEVAALFVVNGIADIWRLLACMNCNWQATLLDEFHLLVEGRLVTLNSAAQVEAEVHKTAQRCPFAKPLFLDARNVLVGIDLIRRKTIDVTISVASSQETV